MSESFAGTEPVPDDFITSDDPARPASELLADIRARLESRPLGPEKLPYLPRFGGRASASHEQEAVAEHLAQAAEILAQLETAALLAPSPVTRLPIIGSVWGFARQQAHQLVLFYVNRQAAQATKVHSHLLAAISALSAQTARQRETIELLQRELSNRSSSDTDQA